MTEACKRDGIPAHAALRARRKKDESLEQEAVSNDAASRTSLAISPAFGKIVRRRAGAQEARRLSDPNPHPVPFNAFQRLARDWEKVYPYNAAQALRLRGASDAAAVGRAWSDALDATGLGRVSVEADGGRRFRFESLNGEMSRYPVRVLPAGTDLGQHFTAELNRPFADPVEPPFRPFLLPGGAPDPSASADSYTIGIVYRHWVADSTAIRFLLREWFARLHDPHPHPHGEPGSRDARKGGGSPTDHAGSFGPGFRAPANATPPLLNHPRQGYWHLFGPGRTRWRPADTLFNLLHRHFRYRRAKKVKTYGTRDYPMQVLLRRAPDGLVDRLRAYAKPRGLKVNDLFLAALAQACGRFVPTQQRRKRPDLAVATIVDLRPHAAEDLSDTFGLFLGFTEVVCPPAALGDFDQLVRSVAAQNERHRRRGVPQSSLTWLAAALAFRRVVPAEGVYHFYRKETPLVGGISNVNLNDTWAAGYAPDPLIEYVRVSPTGPMVPLVLAVTTLGSALHLSLTYRSALLGDDVAREMVGEFVKALEGCTG